MKAIVASTKVTRILSVLLGGSFFLAFPAVAEEPRTCSRHQNAAETPRNEILGVWRGTSTCVDKEQFPNCKDEVVVYYFDPSRDDSSSVSLDAHKIVGGEEVSMGVLEFKRDPKTKEWASDYETPRAKIRWVFVVEGKEIAGKLVGLPDGVLIRKVAVKKD